MARKGEHLQQRMANLGMNTKAMRMRDKRTGEIIDVPPGTGQIHIGLQDKERLDDLLKLSKEELAKRTENIPLQVTLKRQPLMVDKLLALKPGHFPAVRREQERIRNYLMGAKRFVLDFEGVGYVAEIIRKNPKMIARNVEFAIPPFPSMYIEFSYLTFYKELTGREPDKYADATMGYLIHGPHVFVITDGRDADAPVIMPWYYHLNKPWTLQEEINASELMGCSRAGLDAFFWGESMNKLEENEQRVFRANHSMWMMPVADGGKEESAINVLRKLWSNIYDTSAGDLRNITALILLLNRSGNVRYDVAMGPHRAMIHNKPRAFLSHSVVRFKLNPVKRVMQGGGGVGAWRRQHDVRGHWCRDKYARAAEDKAQCCAKDMYDEPTHDWHEYGINEWACVKCKGKRWWRKSCRRGSREKGVVKTTYEVTQ
jgi:hypothetical protein